MTAETVVDTYRRTRSWKQTADTHQISEYKVKRIVTWQAKADTAERASRGYRAAAAKKRAAPTVCGQTP